MAGAISQEFQRSSPRHFFNARDLPTRLAWMLTSLLGSLLNTEEDIKGKKDLQLIHTRHSELHVQLDTNPGKQQHSQMYFKGSCYKKNYQ